MLIREVDHVCVKALDIAAAIRFYADILGGQVISDTLSPDGRTRFVCIHYRGGVIELINAAESAAQGYAHLAFLVDEGTLDAAYSRLALAGYDFTVKPRATGSGDGRLAFFKDASGILYELIERGGSIRQAPLRTGRVIAIDHLTLSVRQAHWDAAAAFFMETLGFTRLSPNSFRFGADTVEFEPFDERYPGIRCVVFQVESCEAITAELRGLSYDIALRDQSSAVMRGVAGERVVFVRR